MGEFPAHCRNAFLAGVLCMGRIALRPERGEPAGRRRLRAGCWPAGTRVDQRMSRASIALNNLRAIVIIIVLAFHSVLAYLASLPPEPFAFDKPPYRWQATPIIDTARWFGFDLFCA